MLFGNSFSSERDIPDLTGKVVIVTGGNSGIGYASVVAFIKKNAKVYMASRTESKAHAAIESIKKLVPTADLCFLPLDLASITSVRAAAKEFTSKEHALHILLNNAGVMALPFSLTPDGYEIQFGTNYLGHFLLTQLLLPTLLLTAQSSPPGTVRVVNVSSLGHNIAFRGIPLGDSLTSRLEAATTWERYGVSKLAKILHTRQLAVRYPQIVSASVHPGMVFSNLYAPFTKGNIVFEKGVEVGRKLWPVDENAGALNQLWASTSSDVTNGEYYVPVGTVGWWGHYAGASRYARNQDLAEKLWEWSEKEVAKHPE